MKKLLRFSFLLLLTMISNVAMADAYKTLTFPDDNAESNKVGSYTKSWTATIGDDSWTIANFNNNSWNNSWEYIRCGSKNAESVATIVNDAPFAAEITKVVVAVDKFTAGSVDALSLIVSNDAAGEDVVETVTAEMIGVGNIEFFLTQNVANAYYTLQAVCPKATANGGLQISKIEYFSSEETPDAGMFGTPAFEVLDGTGVNVKFTFPDSQEGSNSKGSKDVEAVLYEDGVQVATATFGFQMDPTFFFGVHFDYATQEGKTYSVVFPAGAWYIYSEDFNTGAQTVLEESAEQTYEWTGTAGNDNTGDGGNDGDGWKFASVTPAEGAVASLHDLTFAYPGGIMWVNESATLDVKCGDATVAQIMIYDNFAGACTGTVLDVTLTENGTYTLTIPAGSFTDQAGNPNAAMTYTWTIGEAGGDEGGEDGNGWKFASVTPAEGAVASLHDLTFAYPDGIMWVNESATLDVKCGDATAAQIMMYDNFSGACVGTVLDVTLSQNGTYTLTIPAGSFTDQAGNPNAKMTYTWTIGDGEGGGNNDGENPGDIDGDKWQEKIFAQGTAVAIPLNIQTEGVTVTSVGREFMGTIIDVSYDLYEEGELDWKTGTQLVFTAKDNITGIVIDGQFKEFASSDKGNYVNGAWTGLIKAGETVTLTSNDGINIHSIVVLYNGAELQIEDVEEREIATTLNITKTSWATIGKTAGEVIGTISTDAEPFDHYMFEIRCEEDEAQYISFNDLLTREGNIVCTSPTSAGYDLFKGQHYTLTAYVFDTPQYGALPVDVVEYKFVGEGKDPVIYSDETVASVDLKASTDAICQYVCEGLSFNVTFSAPMSAVSAVAPQGMDGSVKLTAEKANEDGTVWTIIIPESLKNGSSETSMPTASIAIVAKDAEGHVLKTANEAHPYEFVIGFYEVEPEPENTVIDIAVERIVGLGYDAEEVEFDGAAVLAALGASAWSDVTVAPVNPLTGEQVAYDFDGWCDPQGVPAGWNTGNGICLKTPTLNGGVYSMALCTFPGLDTEVGTVFPAQWAVNYDGKTVILDVKVTLVAVPEVTFEVVKTIDVPVYITPGVAYEGGNTAAFNLAEVVEALGVTDASAITAYIYQPDGSFVMNTTDGWRDAEGYAAGWNTSASMVCTKMDVLGANFYDIMAIDNTYAEGSAYTAKWALTAGEKAVVFNVNITFGSEPSIDLATLTIGEEVIVLSETEAIELATYPAGAVIAINNDDEAIKKVSYEIVDMTINEIIKSQGDLTKGEDGIWRAEMPKSYDLAAGHDFSIHVMARNGMSSFTSQMIYEYNFLVKGTANVATYSTVEIASVTPGEDEVLTEAEPVITVAFTEAIKSLDVTAILGQMSSQAIAAENVSTEDNITWKINVPAWATVDGNLQLTFVAIDKDGNRVTDKNNGVGLPENCYVQYGWASIIGLPTPQLAENGQSMISIDELTFKYDGIGLNQDGKTATWQNIVILKDGEPMNMTIEESQFDVQGEDAGNALVWTLPVTLYKGVYTIKVPAYAFMLGHDQLNWYSGECEFTVTATAEAPASEPEIALNITKTDWSKIGSQSGEVIGTAELLNAEAFDHMEMEIRCQEDAEQYITFANMMTNGGNLTCYAWEGGSYTLNKGYHYTLIVKAFDVPYYGAEPVATATYEFVGTGAEATKYCDIELAKVDLKEDALLYHGYDLGVTSFDVTFSAPVSKVNVWGAMGMDGSVMYSAEKKSEDGTVWTIVLDENILNEEGSVNLMIQAWDAEGVQAKGWNGDHAFDLNLIISLSDAIKSVEMAYANKTIYTLNGTRISSKQMKKGQIYIVNGKKIQVK